jgi:hypothetical protein
VPDAAEILSQAETGVIVACPKSGYLQHVDHVSLVAAARGGRIDRAQIPPRPVRATRRVALDTILAWYRRLIAKNANCRLLTTFAKRTAFFESNSADGDYSSTMTSAVA